MFESMMASVREEVVSMLFHVEVSPEDAELAHQESEGLIYDSGSPAGIPAAAGNGGSSTSTFTPSAGGGSSSSTARATNGAAAIGRNDPCPCGSGLKYKRCHGRAA
jgi:preprotein translocase subunit SecA